MHPTNHRFNKKRFWQRDCKGYIQLIFNPMISYDKVAEAMPNPPTIEMVDLYNDISYHIQQHTGFVDDKNPYNRLQNTGTFCLNATSIQANYIAFVLGKHVQHAFPSEILSLFFNLDSQYKMQYCKIDGNTIDGCICVVHQEENNLDLQEIYDHIYD